MKIDPVHAPVGQLFRYRPIYFIPKYQRPYAWNKDQISDFVRDVEHCYKKRKQGQPIDHFLGGILSVKYSVPGAVNQHQYEIIDGQQRLATINLLVGAVLKNYNEILKELDSSSEISEIITRRINDIHPRFVEFEQEINRHVRTIEVLTLSTADAQFFRDLIRGGNPDPNRYSHENLIYSFGRLDKLLKSILKNLITIEEKVDALENMSNVVDQDLTVLHMGTDSKDDAYRLFQVINDRGMTLSEGDLLRAKTLEITEGFSHEQKAIEDIWDQVLSDKPNDTANYFNWIYESYKGQRPKANALFDNFLDGFFPQHNQFPISRDQAQQIRKTLDEINKEIENCKKLEKGQWLYENQNPVTGWDRNRLSLLVVELGHTLVLTAAQKCSKFGDLKM